MLWDVFVVCCLCSFVVDVDVGGTFCLFSVAVVRLKLMLVVGVVLYPATRCSFAVVVAGFFFRTSHDDNSW